VNKEREKYQPSSELGWIDFSENDRNKVLKVLEMLKPSGTVDELGVGVVRDSLSDAMFPGITTIMTRAKYYFIVPRILCSYLSDKRIHSKINMRQYLREEENEIIHSLAKEYDYNEDHRIIGINIATYNKDLPKRRWKELVRKPSSIYWNGMRSFGIYKGQMPLSVFLDNFNVNSIEHERGYDTPEGETGDDRDAHINAALPFKLPEYSKNWKDHLGLDLSPDEASFLQHKIIDNHTNTLLAELLKNKKYCLEFLDADSFQELCNKPFIEKLPEHISSVIYLARDFWQIMGGAHIRYNLLIQEKKGVGDELKREFTAIWENWAKEMRSFQWDSFDQSKLWEITSAHNRRVKPKTFKFINRWIDSVKSGIFDEKSLDELVIRQESDNKGNRSKLKAGNDDKYDEWIGLTTMSFRFGNARLIFSDIIKGLNDAGL